MGDGEQDNVASQSAAAGKADRPISTILAANTTPNVVSQSATSPLHYPAGNSANKKRAVWRDKRIQRVLTLASQKGSITNRDVRLALRVKQSTATEYLV